MHREPRTPARFVSSFRCEAVSGETLNEFVNRFGAQVVRVGTTEESMIVHAFRKGVCPGSFNESLIRCRPKSFAKIRHRAMTHIATKGEVVEKCACVVPDQ